MEPNLSRSRYLIWFHYFYQHPTKYIFLKTRHCFKAKRMRRPCQLDYVQSSWTSASTRKFSIYLGHQRLHSCTCSGRVQPDEDVGHGGGVRGSHQHWKQEWLLSRLLKILICFPCSLPIGRFRSTFLSEKLCDPLWNWLHPCNRAGLTPLTLAAYLARMEMFFHIASVERYKRFNVWKIEALHVLKGRCTGNLATWRALLILWSIWTQFTRKQVREDSIFFISHQTH